MVQEHAIGLSVAPLPRLDRPAWRRLSLQELTEILHAPDPDGHYGVPISLAELAAANHGAAEMLLKAPRQVPPPPPPPPLLLPLAQRATSF